MMPTELDVPSPGGLVDRPCGWCDALVNELTNDDVYSCEPQLGLLATRRPSNGSGLVTCGICGTRERKRSVLFREIASAAVFMSPGT